MSSPRYPEYKDSGVEWLGAVPAHWEIRKARWLCEIKKRIAGELGYDVLSITQGGIRVRDLESNDGQLSMDYTKYQFVEVGDFAMNHMDLLTGYVDVSNVRGVTSPDYRVFSIRDSLICHDRYLLYLFQMGYKNKIFYAYGQGSSQLGRWRLPTEQFNELAFPLPTIIEQTQIAAFLDRETAKIDELVAEQRRLMELLKEKRQAVISHAVTHGLNPDAPMKPSGIEWLGDVPAHWEVIRLKYLGEAIIGLTYSPADIVDESNGTLVLRSSNVQGGKIVFDDNVYVSTAIPDDLLTKVGDILICSRNGSRALIGKNAEIDEFSAGLTFGAFMTIFRSQHSAYVACILNSPLFEFQSGAFMTSTINQLTIGVLNNFEVPLPPADEREQIASFLKMETKKLDSLTSEAQRAIDLLQERRTALISASVTGQIDVRNFVPELEVA
jgi:type I restriction enzyme, S subunit